MAKKPFPLADVYGLLEPGPVVLLSTAHKKQTNVMAMSWHTMMEFEPPLIGCVVSGHNHSFELLRKSRECVINIPSIELAGQVVGCGNSSGRDIDKFAAFDLTRLPAAQVKAPLIKECYANLECRIADTKMIAKYNLFVLEVVAAWIDKSRKPHKTLHHLGKGKFMAAGEVFKLASLMR